MDWWKSKSPKVGLNTRIVSLEKKVRGAVKFWWKEEGNEEEKRKRIKVDGIVRWDGFKMWLVLEVEKMMH